MATVWTLDAISFNSGADVNGVEWWGTYPMGWHTPVSTGRLADRVTANGSIITGARVAHRSLLISKAQVIAPSLSARWAAENLLEAAVEAMIDTPATLTVDEPGGSRSIDVRYMSGFTVRVLQAASFEFDLPLVALDPAKS